MATLKETYTQIQPKLQESLGLTNIFATPKLEKIVVNVGWGELKGNEPLQKLVQDNIALITGQKPVATRAKKSIAGFKVREGDLSGYRVTLRGQRMYDFLERLITYVFPRIRDFQGMSLSGFDRHGNYSFGLKEHGLFPEVPYESAAKAGGMQITIVSSAHDNEGIQALLTQLGFPFEKKQA